MTTSPVAYTLMAAGAVLALIAAAGPIATSPLVQVGYGLSLLVLVAGAVARRVGARHQAASAESGGHVDRALLALERLSHSLGEVRSESGSIQETARLHRHIEEATRPAMKDFLDHRQSLLDAMGLRAFAELMTRFATVERLVNRSLSASADGALGEARRCLDRACDEMQACLDARPGKARPAGDA